MGLSSLQPGSEFAGRYQVVRCLAAGGMGAVYEVIHLGTDRRRALKIMLPELAENPKLRERFKREAKITANVGSEFIVEVFDAGIDPGTSMPFLVMELLEGEELGQSIAKRGALPPEEVMALVKQIASALDKTHAAGIVHRDLKPENLFLTRREDGSVRTKILDFGISKLLRDGGASANVTKTVGTPLYMAPEQMAEEPISPATDLYSLALIVYALLVGAPYWQEEADRASSLLVFAVLTKNGPEEEASVRATRFGATLPAAFDGWFRRATARDPKARFQRASELAAALAEALGLPAPASVSPFASTEAPLASATSLPFGASLASTLRTRARVLVTAGALLLMGLSWAAYDVFADDPATGKRPGAHPASDAVIGAPLEPVVTNVPAPPTGDLPASVPLVLPVEPAPSAPLESSTAPPTTARPSRPSKTPRGPAEAAPPARTAESRLRYTRD